MNWITEEFIKENISYSQLIEELKLAIDSVYLWGRNFKKSKGVISSLNINSTIKIEAVEDFSNRIKDMDIISCITSADEPLIENQHLSKGQHFDLAGSYTESMQEVSIEVVSNCSIYTDNFNITLEHAEELVNAIKEKKINKSDIKGDLKFLCRNDTLKRISQEENTMFKSTGMAIEDLVMSSMVYKKFNETTK